MALKSLALLGFVAAAVAQDSAAASSSFSFDTSLPSSLSVLEACATAEESIYSGIPTLASSIDAILATVVPTSVLTETGCEYQSAIVGYYASLPASVVAALSSYDDAVSSWYNAHSSELSALASSCAISGTSTYTLTSLAVPTCGTVSIQPGASVTGGHSSATTTPAGTAGGAKTSSGQSATAAGSGSSASTSKSSGGAAPTGSVALGAAGVAGLLGLLVAL